MNRKTGLFRVWAVGAVIWIVAAAIANYAPRNLNYAYTYHFHYSTLASKENAQSRCEIKFDVTPYERMLQAEEAQAHARSEQFTKRLGVPVREDVRDSFAKKEEVRKQENERARLAVQSCIANFKPEPPEWEWLAPVLLPPTLGVVAAGLLLWIVFVVARWVWRGFRAG